MFKFLHYLNLALFIFDIVIYSENVFDNNNSQLYCYYYYRNLWKLYIHVNVILYYFLNLFKIKIKIIFIRKIIFIILQIY